MSLYSCKVCGKLFERKSNGTCCPGPHYRKCEVCGELFEYRYPSSTVRTCSRACTRVAADRSKKQTIKYCKECGKSFHAAQASQIYCPGPHTSTCVVCDNEFTYTCRPSEKPKTCSRSCQTELQAMTYEAKTGYRNPSSDPTIQAKLSKIHKSEEVKSKTAATNLKRYGYDNIFHDASFQQYVTALQRSDEFKHHRYDVYKAKTGFDHPMQDPNVIAKRRTTNQQRYNMNGRPHTRADFERLLTDSAKVDEYIQFRSNPEQYIMSHFDHKPSPSELAKAIGSTESPVYDILIATNTRQLATSYHSTMEQEIYDYLSSQLATEIKQNDRTVIKPLELDFYLPEYSLGIECNPVSTHNSAIDPWGYDAKSIDYHQNKSLVCMQNNTVLIHVFGYEWNLKQSVVKSIISHVCRIHDFEIHASKCKIINVSRTLGVNFVDCNSLDFVSADTQFIGLATKDNELIAVVEFYLNNTSCIIHNYCTKLFTNVKDGLPTILEYMKASYELTSIISYVSIAHDTLDYTNYGFEYITYTYPNCIWSDVYDSKYQAVQDAEFTLVPVYSSGYMIYRWKR